MKDFVKLTHIKKHQPDWLVFFYVFRENLVAFEQLFNHK